MMALFVWWFALPALARRLMGAVLVCGIVAAAIALAVHRYGNSREATGYAAGYNHAVVIETRKQAVIVDSLERRADSASAATAKRDSAFHPTVIAQHRIERIDSTGLVPTVPLSQLVRIYVASDSLPHYADAYIGHLVVWYDSIVYKTLLPQRDSAIVLALAWKRAWGSEHEAREGADSLASLWRERALANVAPPAAKSHRLVYVALGVAAGFLAAKRLH